MIRLMLRRLATAATVLLLAAGVATIAFAAFFLAAIATGQI